MKKQLTIFILALSFHVSAQQWISDSKCNSDSAKIINEAISHIANIEQLVAVGMAKAVLMSDNKCECAKLVLAAAASGNQNFGSRKSKLSEINTKKLSAEEKAWYDLLVATTTEEDDWSETYSKAIEEFPNSPLINWFSTSREDWNTYTNFAEKFPANAAAAYNMLAYAHAYGEIGDGPDYDAAFASLDQLEKLHTGPNSYDSRAEIAAMKGDYETALNNQLKAFDYATSSSPYQYNLPVYWRKVNESDVSNGLIEAQKNMQNAILEGSIEDVTKYISDDFALVTGDSNLGDFYNFSIDNIAQDQDYTWNSFDLRDFKTHFSPDMRTAILTFYASGSYTFTDSSEEVAYSTRASSVWIATDQGWKCAHANWAPYKNGTGIPN